MRRLLINSKYLTDKRLLRYSILSSVSFVFVAAFRVICLIEVVYLFNVMSPLRVPILVICVFSFFFLVSIARGL